jgi:hypothetical protein
LHAITVYADYLRTQKISFDEIKKIIKSMKNDELATAVNELPKQLGLNNINQLKPNKIYENTWCLKCEDSNPIKRISQKYTQCSKCYNVQLYKFGLCNKCDRTVCMPIINEMGTVKCVCLSKWMTFANCYELIDPNYHIKKSSCIIF